jgi:hypothetical protein
LVPKKGSQRHNCRCVIETIGVGCADHTFALMSYASGGGPLKKRVRVVYLFMHKICRVCVRKTRICFCSVAQSRIELDECAFIAVVSKLVHRLLQLEGQLLDSRYRACGINLQLHSCSGTIVGHSNRNPVEVVCTTVR